MGKVILGLLVVLSAYGIVSCTIKEREREKAKEEQKEAIAKNDELNFDKIKNKLLESNADISWIKKFGFVGDKSEKFTQLYTNQIQDAFLNGTETLIFGDIEDFSNLNVNTYVLDISTVSFGLEMMRFVRPKLHFKFECPKDRVDKVITEFNASYKKKVGFGINVAVFGRITKIEDYSYKTSEGEIKNGKLIFGTCSEVMLAPQAFGSLKRKIESL